MNTWNARANDLFLHAAELSSNDERRALLDRECSGDAALQQEVESLLAAFALAGGFLESPAAVVETVELPPPADAPGTVIGPYKLLEQLGEGGFGIVFVAEQSQPVRRKVALKVLKPGMDTRQVVARFEAERQALAIMDHPNIARVFDGGTTPSGRPYFVMELVRGTPITEFCDQNHRTPRQRLELFLQVCGAVQHAHQKGIIHRDLKPTNVLVSRHDTTPVVKVIDFGVAKALGQALTDKTLFTGVCQMLGTPLYMSPEQAGMSDLDVDTRSDVYSLGVLLYELLTGTTPFDKERFRTIGYDEMRRIIREEEPARPSTRLSTLGQSAVTVSANRGSEPRKLSALIRGDLDWVVMKALEKDRNRRYESASALAADVQRYLADEPVLARPPSIRYRLGKYLRRNRGPVLAGGVVFLGLFGALLGAAYGSIESAKKREMTSLWEQATVAKSDAEAARDGEAYARLMVEKAREKLVFVEYGRTMQVAYEEWRDNNVPAALDLLNSTRADLRGWEWWYVYRLCHSHLLAFKGPGATPPILSASFSPDRSRVVTGGEDSVGKVWDAVTGAQLLALHGHSATGKTLGILSASFSPDGTRVLTAGRDCTARVWDAKTGTELLILQGHTGVVWSASFSPDSSRVVTGSGDGTARIWDARNGVEILALEGHSIGTRSVSFSPDGSQVLTGGGDGTARIWNSKTGAELRAFEGHTAALTSASFSPDGMKFVTGSLVNTARIWDAKTGAVLVLKGHLRGVLSASFSPDGAHVITGGHDRAARIWDARTGVELSTLRGHISGVSSVVFSSDGALVLTGSWDGTAKVWDAKAGIGSLPLRNQPRGFRGAAFSPDSSRVLTGGRDGSVKVWDAKTGAELLAFGGHDGIVYSVSFSPDGTRAVSGSQDGTTIVWDARTGNKLLTLKEKFGEIRSASFSPDGTRVLTGGVDGMARVWDATTGAQLLAFKGHTGSVWSASFSPDGTRVVTGSWDGTARIWNAESGAEILVLKGHTASVSSVSFSPDGGRVLTGARDRTAKVWDARTGAEFLTLIGHTGWVETASFSRDGRRVVTGSENGATKVWDARTGAELLGLKAHTDEVQAASFSPDGSRVLTGSIDGTARLWDGTPLR